MVDVVGHRALQQTVCGFDLLRANGQSYVCDVNGFSFVKSSHKYYEDTAKILGNMILRRLYRRLKIPWKQPYQPGETGYHWSNSRLSEINLCGTWARIYSK